MHKLIPAISVIEEARKLVGARWRHCGRKPWAVDCIGLVTMSCKGAGFDLCQLLGFEEPKFYSREASPITLQLLRKNCFRIDKPVPGCLVVIIFSGQKLPQHFALYTERATIIHSHLLHDVIEHGYRPPFSTKLTHSLWKLPGIEYGS